VGNTAPFGVPSTWSEVLDGLVDEFAGLGDDVRYHLVAGADDTPRTCSIASS
jgi:hypothetical protein